MSEWIWDTLAIAPTGDVATVRAAYAKALKQIDMDAEPQRYIALRNARDYAIHEIRQAAARARENAASSDGEVSAPADGDVASDADGRVSLATTLVPQADFESHLSALTALLVPHQVDGAVPPIDAALARGHFDALLLDPRMEQLGFHAQAEAQLAQLIASSLPRSDCLAKPAIVAFNWVGPARVDTPPAVAAILDAAKTSVQRDAIPVPEAAPETPPVAEPAEGDADANFYAGHYSALAALFFPQTENAPPLTPEERVAARAHFATLLSDPRMELVTFRVGAEAQFAQLIAYSIPRSDCIVPVAIDFFEWGKTEGQIDQSNLIAHILNRARGLRFLDAVQGSDHPLHAAWIELTTPLGPKQRSAVPVNASSVHHLLTSIRAEQPLIEHDLDPGRVAMWDEKLARYGSSAGPPRNPGRHVPLWVFAVAAFLIIAALGQLGRLSPDTPNALLDTSNMTDVSATPVGARQDLQDSMAGSAADIDPVLAEIGGDDLTLLSLRDKNTPLSTQLDSKWMQARDEGQSLSDFQKAIEKFLLDRVALTIANADDADLVTDYQRQRLDMFKTLRSQAPGDCVELGRPGKVAINDVPVNIPAERRELYARILERSDIVPAVNAPVYLPLDSGWVETAGMKIGVAPSTMRMLLEGRTGSYIEQCDARIAEFETLLALPPRARTFQLRSL